MDKTKSKLNRVEGQIRGIQKMYDEGRGCLDIVQQLVAVRQALGRIGKDILAGEAVACSRSVNKKDEFDELIGKLFDLT
jgi:DNA-binding FrmR family transcriptional regulator